MKEEFMSQVETLKNMKLHEIMEIHSEPYYRIMRVPSGWLYNFYDVVADNYLNGWIFIPKL